jgi:hypothetical protein
MCSALPREQAMRQSNREYDVAFYLSCQRHAVRKAGQRHIFYGDDANVPQQHDSHSMYIIYTVADGFCMKNNSITKPGETT